MPEGIFVVSVSFTDATSRASLTISLDNGGFIVTPANATYPAPWGIAERSAEGIAFQIVDDQFLVSGEGGSFYGQLVFQSDSGTIEGKLTRSDASVDAGITLPPERLSFASGSNELPFRVTYRTLDDGDLRLETPEWARGLRPGRGA